MTANKHVRVWLKQPCVVSAPSAFLDRKPQTASHKPRRGHISCEECLAQECLANTDAKLYNRCPVSKIKHNRLGRKSQTEDLKPRDLSPQKRPVGIWPEETLGHTAYVDAMDLQCFASISDTANN